MRQAQDEELLRRQCSDVIDVGREKSENKNTVPVHASSFLYLKIAREHHWGTIIKNVALSTHNEGSGEGSASMQS